jgi:hypothetical protein
MDQAGTAMSAASRFSNSLRYRHEDHPAQSQLTPPYVLDLVREAFGGQIGLDPCTTSDNPVGATMFFCPPVDGASQEWDADSIFVNPPYGKSRERWVDRCIAAGRAARRVVLLIPAATDTRIFQKAMLTAGDAVFIRGRLKFGTVRPNLRQAAASHPSALLAWNVSLWPCAPLGVHVNLAPPAMHLMSEIEAVR